ncbi:NAD(P)/FAD-dependent oxidoreductase [Helicobacter cetorum]|uniref:NAD(P)/FAD-dependent oxidoreductase n=1 Tax=Helicobacter cetorum TaxID=138563 RepID=UPI000CF0C8B2|nr:FAD-dependent oxidoreductase [Helicobacter cetorum]
MANILVLGAGYASLSFIKNVPQTLFDQHHFTLISNTNKHCANILLHEIASGIKTDYLFDLNDILPKKVCFIQDEIIEIKQDSVIGNTAQYAYDFLIVGLGFMSDDFNIKGVSQHTYAISHSQNALYLHVQLIQALKTHDLKNPFNLVVCGGGFSGIEILGALKDNLPMLLKQLHLPSLYIQLSCIEAMPSILPMFSPKLVKKALNYLHKQGIMVYTNHKILECQEKQIHTEKDHQKSVIPTDFTIWTCGVKGNIVIGSSSLFKSDHNRVEVNEFLNPKCLNAPNIFILGDCAALRDRENQARFYPPSAQLASQMGYYVALNFENILNHNAIPPFIFKPKGTICSLSSRYTIGYVGQLNLSGLIASLFKRYTENKWKKFLLYKN